MCVCVWASFSVCAVVKMPQSVFCVFVCMHACVHTLNATIQESKLLIQTTVELKSINNTRIHSKNDVILVQRAWWKWEVEEQQRWIPANRVIFSTEKNIHSFMIITSQWLIGRITITRKKYCSLWVNLIRLSHVQNLRKVPACRVAVPTGLHSQRSFL